MKADWIAVDWGTSNLRAWAMAPEIDLTDDDRAEIDRILPVGWAWGDRYDDAQSATAERYC